MGELGVWWRSTHSRVTAARTVPNLSRQPIVQRRGAAANGWALTSDSAKGDLIRLATWNCCQASSASVASAVAALRADLTVLQEARRPSSPPPGYLWVGANPQNGLAVVPAPGGVVELGPIVSSAPWSIVPVQVVAPILLHLLMVWTRKEHGHLEGLASALTAYGPFLRAAPCVVLGDFNANAIWDRPKRPLDFSRLAKRLTDEFGLVSAYHARSGESFGTESQATYYFWRRQSRPFHIDYCFLPAAWLPDLQGVAILDKPPWDALSDHRPLVIEYRGRVV